MEFASESHLRMKAGSTRSARLSTVFLCLTLGLLLSASAASGARTLTGAIDESSPGEALEGPHGLAVDSTDHLWVTDRVFSSGAQVYKYSSAGTWEDETNPRPWGNHQSLESIAFNEAAGKLFVSDSNVDSLWGLSPANASYVGPELKPFASTTASIRVAADNSDGRYDGALYVFSGAGRIVRININSAASPIPFTQGSAAGTNELTGADTPQGSFAGPRALSGAGLAIDAVGHIWVADSAFPGDQVVHEFAPSGHYIRTITHAGVPELAEVNAVAIDPTTGNVVVSESGTGKIQEFTADGDYIGATPIIGGVPIGLAVDSTGKLYVAVDFLNNSRVDIFSAAGPAAAQHVLEIEVSGAGEVVGPDISCTQAGNGSAACEGEFVDGSEIPLEAIPTAGHRFVGWALVEGNAGSCTGSTAACETAGLVADTKLQATFIPRHSLDVSIAGSGSVTSAPTGIDCGTTCSAEFDQGASVVLTATPGANSQNTVAWTGCNSSTATTCTVSMTAAKSVSATFSPLKRGLNVAKSGNGAGTVTSAPTGIDCGAVCAGEFDHGTSVTLIATPGANTKAVAWTGCDSFTATTCTVAMTGAKSVGAKFDLLTRAFATNMTGRGSGSVTCDGGRCASSYEHGAKVTVHATADQGSTFAGWSGGGCGSNRTCEVTVVADTTLTARFEKVPPVSPRLRIRRALARVVPSGCATKQSPGCAKVKVRGSIVKAATGQIKVTVSAKVDGRKISATTRASIRDGRWKTRLFLAGLELSPNTKIRVVARFAGSSGVSGGRTKRNIPLAR